VESLCPVFIVDVAPDSGFCPFDIVLACEHILGHLLWLCPPEKIVENYLLEAQVEVRVSFARPNPRNQPPIRLKLRQIIHTRILFINELQGISEPLTPRQPLIPLTICFIVAVDCFQAADVFPEKLFIGECASKGFKFFLFYGGAGFAFWLDFFIG
jgi:hypothetical protein